MMKKIKVGIAGEFQAGKSTLVNCLLGQSVATVGDGRATTHSIVNYLFSEREYVETEYISGCKDDLDTDNPNGSSHSVVKSVNVYLNNPFLKHFTLVDMPGYGYNGEDNGIAETAVSQIDYAIVVMANFKAIGGDESMLLKFIKKLQKYQVPYYLYLNCMDVNRWHPQVKSNRIIYEESVRYLNFYPPMSYLHTDGIPAVNLMWYWYLLYPEDPIFNGYKGLLYSYGMTDCEKKEVEAKSNFVAIEKIFGMENCVYLELKKEFKAELAKLRDEVCPVGTIQAFAFKQIPRGWMICDGRKLDSNKYRELFNTIGTTFGESGEDTFHIPDLRGRFVRGWSAGGKLDSCRTFGSKQLDTFQEHSHKVNLSSLEVKSAGRHDHDLYWGQFEMRDHSCFDSNNHTQQMPLPYRDINHYIYSRVGKNYHLLDGTTIEGDHIHEISMKDGERLVDLPTTVSSQGAEMCRTGAETRPANVALLYCIKACSCAVCDFEGEDCK